MQLSVNQVNLEDQLDPETNSLIAGFLQNKGTPIVHLETGGAPDWLEKGVLTTILLLRAGCKVVQVIPTDRQKVKDPIGWSRECWDFFQLDGEIINLADNGRYILATIDKKKE